MANDSNGRAKLRFSIFEVDLATNELFRRGLPLHLQEKPFQILAELLARPGEIVAREELQKRLWPNGTFVDFDKGLNTAVKKLRHALGDSPDAPIFIETLQRKGYRFIAPVYSNDSDLSDRSHRNSESGDNSLNPAINKIREASGDSAECPQIVETTAGRDYRVVALVNSSESRNHLFGRLPQWMGAVSALALAAGIGVLVWIGTPISAPKIVGSRQITNDGLPKTSGPLIDGTRLYFGEFSSGRNILNQVSAAGGESEPIETSVPDPVIEDFSPEESQLLVQAGKDGWNPDGGDFWLVTVPKGPTRRIEGVIGRSGGWVPTHNGEFYFSKGKDLYIANHDGSNARRISTAPGQVGAIRSSPDGSRLRFTVYDLGTYKYSLWEVQLDGSALHPVLPGWNDPPRECCGSWTRDGRYYVFQGVQYDIGNIWVMRERNDLFKRTTSTPMQLTTGPVSYTRMAANDGKQLFAVGEQRRAELVAYDNKSGNFVVFLGGMSAGDVDFSRDGKWVAYVTYPDGLVWRSRLDGSERVQLTFPPMHAALVHWSPDGKQIAFSAIAPGRSWRISLISRDGGPTQQLTSSDLVEVEPNWSPDGKTLAYGVYHPGRPDQNSIQLLDLKTRRSSQLPGSEGVCFPRWSPNGRYIVATSFDAKKLALFDFKTSSWRPLITNVGSVGYFSWSSDSAYVYFDNSLTNDPAYLRVRISDSKLDRIASLKQMRRYISDFGVPWSGLGPGKTPLFTRDISTQEIYALDWKLP